MFDFALSVVIRPPTFWSMLIHAPYYSGYIARVPDAPLAEVLERRPLAALIDRCSEEQLDYRYAPGKWSIREALIHCSDTERVFAYRLLWIARGNASPLPGFDQDEFVEYGPSDATLEDLSAEYHAVRDATLALLRTLPDEALDRIGEASGYAVNARALAHMLAGHELHHVEVFTERYGL